VIDAVSADMRHTAGLFGRGTQVAAIAGSGQHNIAGDCL
jgi:hypothetical protein